MQKKSWNVELSKYALKHLKKLGKKTYQRILNTLEELERLENPLLHKDVRPLLGKLRGFYRLRVGNYRIIFDIDKKNKRICVHIIVSREGAY